MKSTPTQSEGDPESNDISIGNNNNIALIKSISIQNFENSSDLNKKNSQTDFPRKSKTNYIKSTSILKKRIIYDKGQLHKMNKNNLSQEKEENESINNNEYNENEKIS